MGRFVALRRRDDFRRTMKDGRRAADGGMTVFVRRRARGDEVRLGCIVKSRGAVARNRARRRARAALRAADPPGGMDVVVRMEGPSERMPFQEMVGTMKKVLQRVGEDGS